MRTADKEVLIQYCEMREEIKDIRVRSDKLRRELERLEKEIVSDTVKGTRRDGTYGPIKIVGIQTDRYYQKKLALEENKKLLDCKELELLELQTKAERYIESVDKSLLRSMLRFSIIDGMTNVKVARAMNRMFPKREIPFTDENVKKRIQRFFENVPRCPDELC